MLVFIYYLMSVEPEVGKLVSKGYMPNSLECKKLYERLNKYTTTKIPFKSWLKLKDEVLWKTRLEYLLKTGYDTNSSACKTALDKGIYMSAHMWQIRLKYLARTGHSLCSAVCLEAIKNKAKISDSVKTARLHYLVNFGYALLEAKSQIELEIYFPFLGPEAEICKLAGDCGGTVTAQMWQARLNFLLDNHYDINDKECVRAMENGAIMKKSVRQQINKQA